MADRLRRECGLEPFLDQWDLTPGEPWQDELADALEQSATAAVFVGPSGVNPWQNEEVRQALDKAVRTHDEFRVIPVLLPGADASSLPQVLAQRTWVDFHSSVEDDVALDRLAHGIRGEAMPDGAYELPNHPAPYRGLLRYEMRDSDIFFGREVETAQLETRLASDGFVAVVGASGSGKSSLVRAGLLGSLADGAIQGSGSWHALVVTPGMNPLRSLAEQVATLDDGGDPLEVVARLIPRFASTSGGLRDAVTALTAPDHQPLLLVVDQFEELLTLCGGTAVECHETARQFVANLVDGLEGSDAPLRVVITLRADFLDKALSLPLVRELLQDRELLLGAMGDEAVREAVVRPAQVVGALFERGVVRSILRDVEAEPGALPLMQHALYELWRRRRGPWLTLEAYEEVGGVAGALRRRADATYNSLTPEQQRIARHIFLRLTTFGEGVVDTRRRVRRSELYPVAADPREVDDVLQALSTDDARLVVADDDSVEVAHEALLHSWGTLRGWLEDNREQLRVHRRLTEAADEWHTRLVRDPDALYRGVRLAEATEWAEQHRSELNAIEAEFLDASQRLARTRLDEERRRNRRLRRRLGAAVVALLLALAGVAGALLALDRANAAEAEAKARALAASALTTVERDTQLAGLLAIEAAGLLPGGADGSHPPTFAALYGVADSPLLATMTGHDEYVWRVRFSPDGTRIATASQDGSARMWNLDGSPATPPFGFGDESAIVGSVAFSPDGDLLVTASGSDARVWRLDGAFQRLLDGHAGVVNSAEFSQNGRVIVTASDDGTARVWDAAGNTLARMLGHSGSVHTAQFNNDGSRVVTASEDGTARVWAVGGNELAVLEDHQGVVNTAEFSPDGTVVVTAGSDGTAKVWDVDGRLRATMAGHDRNVNSAMFNTDGSRIVTTSHDTTARVWDLTGNELLTLSDHADVVWSAEFNDDGRAVTASQDGTARVWEADGTLTAVLGGRDQIIWDAEFSPDGKTIATAGDDAVAQLWNATGSLVAVVGGGNDVLEPAVTAASFSADATRLTTAGVDGVVHLWTVDGDEITQFEAHDGRITAIVYNADGTQMLTAGRDGTAQVHDADGRLRAVLPGHEGGVSAARFSDDGSLVVTASGEGSVRVWESDGSPGPTLVGHEGAVQSVDFSPDGSQILTAGSDGTARLWNLDGTPGPVVAEHDDVVWSAEFSPDGARIVTASSDRTARLWDASGRPLPGLAQHAGAVFSAQFSQDGRQIVTAGEDGTAQTWDLEWTRVGVLEGHSALVVSAAFSPDGGRIVTASGDGTARVWDANGTVLGVLKSHRRGVLAASFSADGTHIVTTGVDGFARIWRSWSFDDALSIVRERVAGREFSRAECTQYAIDPCPATSSG